MDALCKAAFEGDLAGVRTQIETNNINFNTIEPTQVQHLLILIIFYITIFNTIFTSKGQEPFDVCSDGL